MKYLIKLLPAFVAIICCSCSQEHSRPYAIREFDPRIQSALTNIVARGVVASSDSCIARVSDEVLSRIAKSDNPVLRATALNEMLGRKFFNHYEVVLEYLDDSAIVLEERGEFGHGFTTVADYVLNLARWETEQERNKIIDTVFTTFNHLSSAYRLLYWWRPAEKYYPYIKKMALREVLWYSEKAKAIEFTDLEYALYALARFQKKDDVPLIKDRLMTHSSYLSYRSFRLLREFPDTAYQQVLEAYHKRRFYKFSGNRPEGFSGYPADRAAPEDFISALAAQRSVKSAVLLDTMLQRLERMPCLPDRDNIVQELIRSIWENPCPAYARLRKRTAIRANKLIISDEGIPLYPAHEPVDSAKRKFVWYDHY